MYTALKYKAQIYKKNSQEHTENNFFWGFLNFFQGYTVSHLNSEDLPGRRCDGDVDDGDEDEMENEGGPVMITHSHPPSRRKMLVTPDN